MKLIFNLLFIVFFCGSCMKDSNKPYEKGDKVKVYHHLRLAINEGDGEAFNKAARYFLLNGKETEFYYYSLLMANKHNNSEAYFHLYRILTINRKINGVNLYGADKNSKNMSLFYLLKSHELGYKNAKFHISQEFTNLDSIPHSSIYINKYAKK